ncbi:IS1634 family transposase [Microcystis aeruginosa CS-558/01A06]|nr:IS1634 family transposase [Microcystis aeruginosa CS-558/01A06]
MIIHWLKQMKVAEMIDENLEKPHGNRTGLSYGELAVLLLTYIISEGDHRMCCLETWVNEHQRSLEGITGWKIGEKEATDDRCGELLRTLGSSDSLDQIERELCQYLVKAYELPTEKARSDTTSFSVHHQIIEEQKESSLLKFGYSKDKRPDLRQYRQMLATLDPVGLPLLGMTLAGNGTDEKDYVPTWRKMTEILGKKDFLYLADSKASSYENRAKIQAEGGNYCFPLAMSQPRPKLLADWLSNPPNEMIKIVETEVGLGEKEIGSGFEVPLGSIWVDPESKKRYQWNERWLVVKSNALASRQIKGLGSRLIKGEEKLLSLQKRPGKDEKVLEQKVREALQKLGLTRYITYSIEKKQSYKKVYKGLGHRSVLSSYRRVRETKLILSYTRLNAEIEAFKTIVGWRLYVTNTNKEQLSLTEAVSADQEQWQPERGFHRFKKGRLSALPIYFRDEDKIKGLMFLLTIALRVFTLMEFVVRRQLRQSQSSLAGLYDGNPKRSTDRPTAEQMLKAFRNLTLYIERDGKTEISCLNEVQQQILRLMNIPESIYTTDFFADG